MPYPPLHVQLPCDITNGKGKDLKPVEKLFISQSVLERSCGAEWIKSNAV